MSQQRNKPKDTNQSSKLLSPAENNTVFDVLGQRRITKATAVVQLLFANQSPSQWAKQHTGILCFVKVCIPIIFSYSYIHMSYSRLSLIGTRIREISVKEYKVNSPSLYKCMQVTPVNTNKFHGPLVFVITRFYFT